VDNSPPEPKEHRRSQTKGKSEELPEVPVSVCGPVARIVGTGRVDELLDPHTDLGRTAARFVKRIDELVAGQFEHAGEEALDRHRERCRRSAFDRISARHQAKPIANLPAYLTEATKRASHLGDLVGDELVEELRSAKRSRRKGEPRPLAEALPPGFAQPRGAAKDFEPAESGTA
jgi:hypothetical protein